MTGKKIAIKNPKVKLESAEEWVSKREGTKRLTIDVPITLHTKLKISSAKRNETMADIVRTCLEKEFN